MIINVGRHTRGVTNRKTMPSTQITEQGPDNTVRRALCRAQLREVEVGIPTEDEVSMGQQSPNTVQGSIKVRPELKTGRLVSASTGRIEGADCRRGHARRVAKVPPKELRVTG